MTFPLFALVVCPQYHCNSIFMLLLVIHTKPTEFDRFKNKFCFLSVFFFPFKLPAAEICFILSSCLAYFPLSSPLFHSLAVNSHIIVRSRLITIQTHDRTLNLQQSNEIEYSQAHMVHITRAETVIRFEFVSQT